MRLVAKLLAAFGGLIVGIVATAVLFEMNGFRYSPAVGAPVGLIMAGIGWIAVGRSKDTEG